MAVGLYLVRRGGEAPDLGGGGETDVTAPSRPSTGEPAPLPVLAGGRAGDSGGTGAERPAGPTEGDSTGTPNESAGASSDGAKSIRLAGVVRDTEGRPAEGAVLHLTTWTAQVTPDGDHETFFEHAEATADGAGRWTVAVAVPAPSDEGSSPVHGVTIDVIGGGYERAGHKEVKLKAQDRDDVTVTVGRLPAIRVQVLDAATRVAVQAVTIAGCQARADGEWWSLWADAGAREVLVTAAGYVTARPTLGFPATGTVTMGEPILLERGWRVHGVVRAAGGAALAGAFVVADRVGGPPSSVSGFVHAPTTSDDGRFELVLPPGAYRLLAFAKGHAPATADVAVQDGDQRVDPELRRFGTEGPPSALRFRWADRREVAIPIETAELPGAELVAWIEAIVGAPIAIEADARATLAALEMNASFIGVPAGDALNLVAQLAALEFDPDAGAIRVPR